MTTLTIDYLKVTVPIRYITQSNEDTEVLKCDHRLRVFAQHYRSLRDTFLQTDTYSLQS